MKTTGKMKPMGKIIIGLLVVSILGLVLKLSGKLDGLIKSSVSINSSAVALPDAPKTATGENVKFTDIPSTSVSAKAGLKEINGLIMAWNSQLALIYSNGGAVTTEGSLMEQNGVKLTLTRQDNITKASEELIKFAQAYKENPSTARGVNWFAMMGDGTPSTLKGLNQELRKLGDEYRAVVIGSAGRSNGEDALLAPVSWRQNPQAARGSLVSTVIRDGDWNIVVKWAADNNIPINPDEKTWDAEAINFVNASDNVDAGEKYISGYKEERTVVVAGKRTKEKKIIEVNAVSVWTPVDVNVAEKRGGLVRIVSTKEYSSQMPNAIITIKKWAEDNRETVESMLLAMTQGGDQVKSFDSAAKRAGDLSASVYNEQTGEYWTKYAKGVTQSDKQGLQVELGGSLVFNLADNLNTFGLAPNSTNTFAVVYNTFGKIAKDLYPELFSGELEPVEDILDLSYLRNLMNKQGGNMTAATKQEYASGGISQVVAKRDYTIEFAIGSADLTPTGRATLKDIYESLIVANGLKVQVEGHTDNTGSESINQALSEARANAIKVWLQAQSSANFPDSRITTKGYGSSSPVADNSTAFGRAKNRRVVIEMGN